MTAVVPLVPAKAREGAGAWMLLRRCTVAAVVPLVLRLLLLRLSGWRKSMGATSMLMRNTTAARPLLLLLLQQQHTTAARPVLLLLLPRHATAAKYHTVVPSLPENHGRRQEHAGSEVPPAHSPPVLVSQFCGPCVESRRNGWCLLVSSGLVGGQPESLFTTS